MAGSSQQVNGRRSLFRVTAWIFGGVLLLMTALVLLLMASCEDNVPPQTSVPTGAGYREEGGDLMIWTGAPCEGVTRVELTFRVKVRESSTEPNYEYYDLTLTAPYPGIRVEHLNLADLDPSLTRTSDVPDGFDWSSATEISMKISTGEPARTSRVEVSEVLAGSPDYPSDTYLFDDLGWKSPADIARENGTDFITICSPDPADE